MILEGDCRTVMATLEAESIDAIVTDPPYDLTAGRKGGSGPASENPDSPAGRARIGNGRSGPSGGFMGKGWDATGVAFDIETWREALRVAKPGAYLLAFGGTRTYHRMVVAIEDAGWEIRDTLAWCYAQGFPKSLDVSKAIDKAAGAERAVVGQRHVSNAAQGQGLGRGDLVAGTVRAGDIDVTAPATADAEKWVGWGTALKPAWEPICMARKPFKGSVAANVLRYGTAAINIDGTRIPIDPDDPVNEAVWTTRAGAVRGMGFLEGSAIEGERRPARPRGAYSYPKGPGGNTFTVGGEPDGTRDEPVEANPLGRWPANLVLTDPIFDGGMEGVVGGGDSHRTSAGVFPRDYENRGYGGLPSRMEGVAYGYPDIGSYSRFFMIPKASRDDREPVIPGTLRQGNIAFGNGTCVNCGKAKFDGRREGPCCDQPDYEARQVGARENTHATVKPTELMRHLVRLVTPPGGTVLDPFLGSGTTALAAEIEGFGWIGIELDPESVAIINARLPGTQRGLGI